MTGGDAGASAWSCWSLAATAAGPRVRGDTNAEPRGRRGWSGQARRAGGARKRGGGACAASGRSWCPGSGCEGKATTTRASGSVTCATTMATNHDAAFLVTAASTDGCGCSPASRSALSMLETSADALEVSARCCPSTAVGSPACVCSATACTAASCRWAWPCANAATGEANPPVSERITARMRDSGR